MRGLKRCAAWTWTAWIGLVLYVESEFWLRALHPRFWPIAVCLVIMLAAMARGLWSALRLVRKRFHIAVLWLLCGILPAGLLAVPLAYAATVSADRYSPRNRLFNFANVFGAAVMQVEAGRTYPRRMESPRLVMLYGDSVTSPREDLQSMDAHVASLEALLGRNLRDKICWIRGPVFGRAGVSFLGLSLGSEEGPSADIHLDRHELAHGVIDQFALADSDPPALLAEGWAEGNSGFTDRELARRATEEKSADRSLSVRTLVSERWYHRHEGPVYSVGGAFVRYILRRFGARAFLDLYVRGRPGNWVSALPLIIGTDIDSLDKSFWEDAVNRGKANP